jgi:hypothetical protein
MNPDYGKYKSRKSYWVAGLIALPLFLIGLLPFLFQSEFFINTLNSIGINLQSDWTFGSLGIGFLENVPYTAPCKIFAVIRH